MIKRKFLLVVLFITIAFSNTYASEKTIVKVNAPNFNIIINDHLIDNTKNKYPILSYNDITYLPMTYYGNGYMGLNMKMYPCKDVIKDVIFVGNANITQDTYTNYQSVCNQFDNLYAEVLDREVAINTTDPKQFFDNKTQKYPLLLFRGIAYLPLTYHIVVDELDWKISFDSSNRLVIDTRNSNRPIIDSRRIGDSSPQRGSGRMKYVYSDKAYVGFPESTLNGHYTFKFKIKGDNEEEINLFDELSDGDYNLNYSINDNIVNNPKYEAKLENNILTVYCVRYRYIGESKKYQGENILLVIDMNNQMLLKKETLSN